MQRLLRHYGVLVRQCSHLEEHIERLLKKFYGLPGFLCLHGSRSLSIQLLDLDHLGYALLE